MVELTGTPAEHSSVVVVSQSTSSTLPVKSHTASLGMVYSRSHEFSSALKNPPSETGAVAVSASHDICVRST